MRDCLPSRLIRALIGRDLCGGTTDTAASGLTRSRILQAAFEEMYEHGYQGMRIDSVLVKTGLAKGALYHHFKQKKALAYAVVDELLKNIFLEIWQPLITAKDPLSELNKILVGQCQQSSDKDIIKGCPLNNLSQEMAGLDDGFKDRLSAIYESWANILCQAITNGQVKGIVREDVNAPNVAAFIISSIQGILGTAKCLQSKPMLEDLTQTLCDYVEHLRKTPERTAE